MRSNIIGVLTFCLALVALTSAGTANAQERSIEGDLARYWSADREMPVIAGDRLYVTEKRIELNVHGGILPNDAFFTGYPIGLTAGYHFDSIWGIELLADYNGLMSDSELTTFLTKNGAGIRKNVDLGDQQVFRADLVAAFSPLYGKWSFQTYKISHFDLFFLAGAGIVVVDEPEFDGLDPKPEPVTAVHPEGLLGGGFRFFVTDWVAVRLDARWHLYPSFDGAKAPAVVTLGASFFTPQL